ncbi:MAG: hypothetical protein U5R14_06275 [Gemmatimonadota bacterium]|nr:hypothetical protein [Gemmatimonadota bacterium]
MIPDTVFKFVHTVVQELSGLAAPAEGEVVLVDQDGLWACITPDPDPHCADADLSVAVGNMLLRALSGGGPEGTPEERLEQEVEIARSHRQDLGRARAYLVVRRIGEVADFPDSERERQIGEVVVRLNGASGADIGGDTKRSTAAIMLAVSVESEHSATLKPYTTALWYDRGDGRRFSPNRWGAQRPLPDWKSFPTTLKDDVLKTFMDLDVLRKLDPVFNLFLASLENSSDRLRSFQSGMGSLGNVHQQGVWIRREAVLRGAST